ncbi:MAG: hypothetical protein RR424_10850 [Oscillospiraceae bacterium]
MENTIISKESTRQELDVADEIVLSMPDEVTIDDEEMFGIEDGYFVKPCRARYYVNGNNIYISELGELYYDDEVSAEMFRLNAIDEESDLQLIKTLDKANFEALQNLRKLKMKYPNEKFAVVAYGKKPNTIILASELYKAGFTSVTMEQYNALTDTQKEKIINQMETGTINTAKTLE